MTCTKPQSVFQRAVMVWKRRSQKSEKQVQCSPAWRVAPGCSVRAAEEAGALWGKGRQKGEAGSWWRLGASGGTPLSLCCYSATQTRPCSKHGHRIVLCYKRAEYFVGRPTATKSSSLAHLKVLCCLHSNKNALLCFDRLIDSKSSYALALGLTIKHFIIYACFVTGFSPLRISSKTL
jgi:hypothetical protein